MSTGYKQALATTGKFRPLHISKQVWGRLRRIAGDNRLKKLFYTHNLPDSYTALYELSMMPDSLIEGLSRSGLVDSKTSCRTLRRVRITGKVPVRLEVWTEPEEIEDLLERVRALANEFG